MTQTAQPLGSQSPGDHAAGMGLKMSRESWALCYLLALLSSAVSALDQSDLNYMARYVDVRYDVIDNLRDSLKTFEAQITLTNRGSRPVSGVGWELFFCHLNLIEPETLPDPEGVFLPKYNVRFHHLQGCMFKMMPEDGFKPIEPGEARKIRFLSENFSVSKTDALPNWYVAAPGLEPRVLACTSGESLSFMGDFDAPNKWKRYDFKIKDEEDETKEIEGHDRYDPVTPRMRFAMNDAEDVGPIDPRVVPTPIEQHVTPSERANLQTHDWVVAAPEQFENEASFIAERLSLTRVARAPHSHFISLIEDPNLKVTRQGKEVSSPEAYHLRVEPAQGVIEVRASGAPGIFYGLQTLLSLMDSNFTVPKATVVDTPRYEYRGMMLDVARNFRDKETVIRLLDVLATYKLNKLHLHLTDDEGWRLEIPGLEELTQVGARRCHDPTETTCILPFLGSSPVATKPGTGFYTAKDYQDILRHAKSRHIEVIPEVDMPGHGHAAIKAMESRRKRLEASNKQGESTRFTLVDLDDPSVYKSIQMYTDNAVNPCLQSTYNFFSHVLDAVVKLHKDISPLRVFHFGGDEVAKGAWENSTVCEEVFRNNLDIRGREGLKEFFVRKVANLTAQHNLDIGAWEDGVMEGGKNPYSRSFLRNNNVYAYAWDNIWEWGVADRAYKLANAGYKVVMAQATHLYLDHPYEPDPLERGLYWAPRFTDTRKTFSFMPENLYANADVSRSGDRLMREDVCGDDEEHCVPLKKPENIVGIQGHLWSELVRSRDIAEYMVFPRLLAVAERAWHESPWEREEDNVTRLAMVAQEWNQFANTVGYRELPRLDAAGIKYRVPPPGAIISNGKLKVNTAFPGLKVEYSADNGVTWCQVKGGNQALVLPEPTRLQLRTRSADGQRVSRVVHMLAPALGAASGVTSSFIYTIFAALAAVFYSMSHG